MPENATIMMAGVDKKPADTAVSPNTSAPTTDRDMPTYLGIRMLDSFRISKRSNTTNISKLGDKGKERTLLAMVSSKPSGKSCILKSCAEI